MRTRYDVQLTAAKVAQSRLSEEYGIPWRTCTTVISISETYPAHHEMPPWLNIYDRRQFMFYGELKTMFQDRLEVLAMRKMGLSRQDIQDAKNLVRRYREFDEWRAMLTAEEHRQAQDAEALLHEFEAMQKVVRPELEQVTRRFLEGFTDVTGNYWCGQCHSTYQFMNIGQELDYPALWASETEAGYEGWLHTARFSGCVCIESGWRLAKKLLAERRQLLSSAVAV